ncbi:MAG: hypothetical protein HY960_14140 [Ignavibacteriae bacterium]|nr:hypothetical protein [Ignavibacteriota bacterium]
MEKTKAIVTKKNKELTEEQRIINSLLADGAIEITPEMQKQEPYKSRIAKIKYDLVHEP